MNSNTSGRRSSMLTEARPSGSKKVSLPGLAGSVLLLIVLVMLVTLVGSNYEQNGWKYYDITTARYFRAMGFDPSKEYEISGPYGVADSVDTPNKGTRFSFLGAAIAPGFTISNLGFTIQTSEGQSAVELPLEKVIFVIDDSFSTPTVLFQVNEKTWWRKGVDDKTSIWSSKGEDWHFGADHKRFTAVNWFSDKTLAQVLQENTQQAVITLSRETFDREVAPFTSPKPTSQPTRALTSTGPKEPGNNSPGS